MKKLGFETTAEEKKQGKWTCEECRYTFDSERGLRTHRAGKWCRKMETMSNEELARLRRTRQTSATKRGKTVRKVEMVKVLTCEGEEAKPCGEFVYLGSKINTSATATEEISRRIGMAMTSFGSINHIWKAKSASRKTKAALYKSLILTIMLYNAEVWPVAAQDITKLEGAHYRMMRRRMACDSEDEHVSKETLLAAFNQPTIEELIARKRLSWIAHALRRKPGDRAREAVLSALRNTKSKWTRLLMEDCRRRKIRFNQLEELAQRRRNIKNVLHGAHGLTKS